MITEKTFHKMALSLPGTTAGPHFEKMSFRTRKRIFSTLSADGRQAFIKLTPVDQSVFSQIDSAVIYPVPNKWGIQGWTIFDLRKINKAIIKEALTIAHRAAL